MNNFNLTRFCCVLRADLIGNRKGYIMLFLRFFCFLLLAQYLLAFTGGNPGNEVNITCNILLCLVFAICFYGFSRTFSLLSTKQGRISFLMLPATNLEKFAARYLICSVGYACLFFIALFAADMARCLLFTLLGQYNLPISHTFCEFLLNELGFMEGTLINKRLLWILSLVFMANSFYLTGSAYFRKHAFIKTSLCLFLGIVLFLKMVEAILISGDPYSPPRLSMTKSGIVLFLIIAAICTIWSYRRFKRIGVIPRKLFKL